MCGEPPKYDLLVSEDAGLFMELDGEILRITIDKEGAVTDEEKKTLKRFATIEPVAPWGELVCEEEPTYFIEEDGKLVYNT